jgi:hypothetical protein
MLFWTIYVLESVSTVLLFSHLSSDTLSGHKYQLTAVTSSRPTQQQMYNFLTQIMTHFDDIQHEMRLLNTTPAIAGGGVSAAPPLHYLCNGTSANCSSSTDADDSVFETGSVVFIVLFGIVLSILTAGGNLMVMISFKIERQLQTISNYFLLSLAVADVAVGTEILTEFLKNFDKFFAKPGIISIPFMTMYTAMGSWQLSYSACQFWLCLDYLMSNASALNLLLISFDR